MHIFILLRYGFLKKNFLYRFKFIFNYLLCYTHSPHHLYFFGFSRWKRKQIQRFFPEDTLHYCATLKQAQKHGLNNQGKIYIWGKKPFEEIEVYAKTHGIPLYRIEDGFIRSVSLGSDLTKAYSLVIDSRGIYFDPSQPSDLEYILNTHTFDEPLLERARKLRAYLLKNKLSKYNIHPDKRVDLPGHKPSQKVILVPGQVEDDASIIYGANGMTNLELLQQTRHNMPEAYIIYKPHPDVLAGNRKGDIPSDTVLSYADILITDASLDSVLACVDEVHTMTSLVGFEALMRGKTVHTYGLPFYAGWGVTVDERKCLRRQRVRTVDELVAATYILYPRYIAPSSGKLCEAKVTIAQIELMKKRYNNDIFYRTTTDIRNWVSRKLQWMIKAVLGE
jgi:capsular polysaccharide export protein